MMSVSLDGFFEGPNGELDWQLVDDELHRHFNGWLGKAGAFLDGRVTYKLMAGYWPTADADPDGPERGHGHDPDTARPRNPATTASVAASARSRSATTPASVM